MRNLCLTACSFAFFAAQASAPDHPWQINSGEGDYSLILGFLAQGQAEWVRTTTGVDDSQDLYLRRFRLIASGQFLRKVSYFIDMDSPNLKGAADGTKGEGSLYL